MRRSCRNCLCCTCMNICCDYRNCIGKRKECEKYALFEQLQLFAEVPEEKYKATPRESLGQYGITKARYRQLTKYIQSQKYDSIVQLAAHTANKMIARYILLSITQNKSYDALRAKWELKEMEQIPYCRTDFYGIRRYAIHLFDLEMRKIGK